MKREKEEINVETELRPRKERQKGGIQTREPDCSGREVRPGKLSECAGNLGNMYSRLSTENYSSFFISTYRVY
jgi:hypothetical protein